MSEWAYIWMAYGLTWVVLAAYTVSVRRRLRRAEAAAADPGGDERRVR